MLQPQPHPSAHVCSIASFTVCLYVSCCCAQTTPFCTKSPVFNPVAVCLHGLPSHQLLTCCTTRVCMICTHHSSLLHMRFVYLHCTAVRVSTSWLLSQHSSRQSIATPLKFQSPCQSSCNSCWPAALAEVQRQMGPHSKNNNSWAVCNPAPGNTPQGLRSRQQHQTDLHKNCAGCCVHSTAATAVCVSFLYRLQKQQHCKPLTL